MPFVTVTRLHVRSKLYYPGFAYYTIRSSFQAKRSPGFQDGVLAFDAQQGAWTFTLWKSDGDMRAFRNSGPHRAAMPHLLHWCDEASFAHWSTDTPGLPSVEEAHERMIAIGKLSKVNRPSPLQQAGRTVSEGVPRVGLNLRPR
jgi:hypothetical protein